MIKITAFFVAFVLYIWLPVNTSVGLNWCQSKSTNNHVMEKMKGTVPQEPNEMMMWVINMKMIIKD